MGATRKADHVAQDLLARVVAGELAVGDILPREADLAERYGVNRSVVREAIKQLEVHRVVRPVRRRGTEVLDPLRSMSPEVLSAMLVTRTGTVDRDVLADLLELRAAIDELMGGLAAQRRSTEDVAEMREVLATLEASLDDPAEYARRMGDMSLVVARAAKNQLLQALVHWNAAIYAEHESLFINVRIATPPMLQGMAAMVDLIEAQDEAAVRHLVRAFHEWATPRLLAAAALASGELPTEVQQ